MYRLGPLAPASADLAAAVSPRFPPALEEPEQVLRPFPHLPVCLSFFLHPTARISVFAYLNQAHTKWKMENGRQMARQHRGISFEQSMGNSA